MSDTIKLSKLKPNPNNPRVIRDHKFKQLCKSIEDFPKMMRHRPIVVDADYVILGGNMRLRALQFLGFKEIPADWVSVASEFTEDEKPEFVIKDNTNFGEWDNEALANEWDDKPLEEWGHDVPTWDESELEGNKIEDSEKEYNEYSKKIDAPIYEPKNEKPKIIDLFDDTKTKSLLSDIESSNIDKETKDFLKHAAQRHRIFDFSKIADLYAHSDKEVQKLMEDSALVIIDFDSAIRNGFINLSKDILNEYEKQYG